MQLDKLLGEIRACQACEADLPFAAKPVLSLSDSAKLLIIGQAPGLRVHESGVAWNDPSGERLREWMGVDKTVFYDSRLVGILPMGFCYPGKGKNGDLPPQPQCAKLWRKSLHAHLTNVKLTLLIGQYAQRYYLGKESEIAGGLGDCFSHRPGNGFVSLTETVKNWQFYLPQFLPLPHPSPRNNIWLRKNPWFEQQVLPVLRGCVKEVLQL
jgi:uracil-DNA glycosylase